MEVLVDEPLVVAEVEVGLTAVLGDEDLTVLEGVHRARVDVDVRVELAHGDPEATALEQPTERRGGEALAQRGRHPAGEEDELGACRRPVTSPGHPHRAARVGFPGGCGGPSMSGTCEAADRPALVGPGRRRRRRDRRPARPSSSRAWRRADALSGLPDSIRLSSTTRPSGSSTVTSERVRPPRSTLRTSIWWSAWAATWARWVTTSTWAWWPSPARAAPTAVAAVAADPGVHLVEDQHPRCVGEGQADGQHGPGQLAARRRLGQRAGRLAGVGPE